MSYVRKVLQPEESLVFSGRLHWIGYWRAIAFLLLGAGALALRPAAAEPRLAAEILAAAFLCLAAFFAVRTALERWGTEIGVTDRRVIYKRGLIARHTAEMNMDKVETVLVEQSLLGRMLDYGAISIRGSGASIETLRTVARPLALRSAITAR